MRGASRVKRGRRSGIRSGRSKGLENPKRMIFSVWGRLRYLFPQELPYHSGALAFAFLMTFIPLTLLFGSLLGEIIKVIPNLRIELALKDLEDLFPGVTKTVLNELSSAAGMRKASLLTLGVTIVLAINFTRNLERALRYIVKHSNPYPDIPSKHAKPELSYSLLDWRYWLYFLILSLIFLLTLFVGIILDILPYPILSLFKKYGILDRGLQVVILTLNLSAIYKLLLPFKLRLKDSLKVGLIVSLIILTTKYLFSFYSVHWLRVVPIYGTLAYILLFLIWLNLIFTIVLVGARYLMMSVISLPLKE